MTGIQWSQADRLELLVVDDSEVDRRLVRRQLERGGFHVQLASDGNEALQLAERSRPTGIVMDVRMPGMSGLQVLERIRRNDRLRDVPVVLISAEHDTEALERALSAGADDFLPKPLDFWQLRARLSMILYLRACQSVDDTQRQLWWVCDSTEFGYLSIDGYGNVLRANDAARRMLVPGPRLLGTESLRELLEVRYIVPDAPPFAAFLRGEHGRVSLVLQPRPNVLRVPAAHPMTVTIHDHTPATRIVRLSHVPMTPE